MQQLFCGKTGLYCIYLKVLAYCKMVRGVGGRRREGGKEGGKWREEEREIEGKKRGLLKDQLF